ncbi:hypothetical protein R6Q57_025105 [Mikania cordata]
MVELEVIRARVVGGGVEVGNWKVEVDGSEEIMAVIDAIVGGLSGFNGGDEDRKGYPGNWTNFMAAFNSDIGNKAIFDG